MTIGIILGPIAAKFLDSTRWGSAAVGQQGVITLVRASLCPAAAVLLWC